MEKYDNCELLIDGKNAFPEIIRCIQNSQKSILINMFIWRDDTIGNIIAQEVYEAAERGVKVTLSVDRYGVICEKAEEAKKSFFHKEQTLKEKISINFLNKHYPGHKKHVKDIYSDLYKKIMNHPNIVTDVNTFKADHSKYYIFDDEVLILGGINIEDKENGHDFEGRIYSDYMLKITSKEEIVNFKVKMETGTNRPGYVQYLINSKKISLLEIRKAYLEAIDNAQEFIKIHMAYFSPLKDFIKAIVKASKRGVKVDIVIPKDANMQDDLNKKALKILFKKSKGRINCYFTPKMAHTKLLVTDSLITFGSANINKKAFNQLDELNVIIPYNNKDDNHIVKELMNNIKVNEDMSHLVTNSKEIKYNNFVALLESFLV